MAIPIAGRDATLRRIKRWPGISNIYSFFFPWVPILYNLPFSERGGGALITGYEHSTSLLAHSPRGTHTPVSVLWCRDDRTTRSTPP